MKVRNRLRIVIIDVDFVRNMQEEEYSVSPSYEVARLLSQAGHSITFISSKPYQRVSLAGEKVTIVFSGISSKIRWLNKLSFFCTLPFVIRKIHSDIILDFFSSKISLQVTPILTKVPVIGIPGIFAEQRPDTGIVSFLFPLEGIRLRLYRNFVAYTPGIADFIRSVHSDSSVQHIPLAIAKEFHNMVRQQPEHLLFLGNFNMEKKGIDLLLQAYAKIYKKIQYPLIVAGHGKDEMKIRSLIKRLKIERYVQLVGPTYGDKKISLFEKALLLTYPARYDDVPIVAVEGITAGVPLVSFDIPELSWAEETFSLKALPYDVNDYARLLKYASESASISKMQKAALEYSKKFNHRKIGKTYEKFIHATIKNHRRREERLYKSK